MDLSRRLLLGTSAAVGTVPRGLHAQAPGLKIGVLTDLSGPYQDLAGPLAVGAAQLATEDFGVAGRGMHVAIISADHQNKPDVGAGIARQWFDREGVDAIFEVANSAVGLAVAGVARDKNKVYVNSGAATSDLTGAQCNRNTIHWAYDTYMLARSTGGAMVRAGGDSWYFITADYAFGQAMQRDTTKFITDAGGRVLGGVRYPFPGTTDFSSLLLSAASSGAKVLGIANAGTDTTNTIKQAAEFGVSRQMKLAGLLVFISDVHAMGLEVAQGTLVTDSYYWDHTDDTRAFAERMRAKGQARPGMVHAGVYLSVLHYLKTAVDLGIGPTRADGGAVVDRMKAIPTNDQCFGRGSIRADGRKIHPSYLWEVKRPMESKAPWDYYKPVATTAAERAFRPLDAGSCPMVKA